jgi:hypothetical protein
MEEAAEYREIEARQGIEAADRLYATRRHLAGTPVSWWRGLDAEAQEVAAHAEKVVDDLHPLIKTDDPFKPLSGTPKHQLPPELEGAGGPGVVQASGPSHIRDWDDPASIGETTLDGSVPTTEPSGSGRATGASGFLADRSFVDTPAGRVLAPGGVIGPPELGRAGGPGTPGSTARPGASAGMVLPPMMGLPGGSGATSSGAPSGRRSRRGLPSVFEVPSSQPAVLCPPDHSPVHDPGPGVIGIDR